MTGQPETIELKLARDGEHLILVRDFFGQPGVYQIQLMAMQAEQPVEVGELVYSQTAVNNLQENRSDAWAFEGEIGEQIDIQVEPSLPDHDLVLGLVAPSGESVLKVDATGNGEQETIAAFELTENGRWQIVIEEFFGQAAPYNLSLQNTP